MTQIYQYKSTTPRVQSDFISRGLTLANAHVQRPTASFDGGLVS